MCDDPCKDLFGGDIRVLKKILFQGGNEARVPTTWEGEDETLLLLGKRRGERSLEKKTVISTVRAREERGKTRSLTHPSFLPEANMGLRQLQPCLQSLANGKD